MNFLKSTLKNTAYTAVLSLTAITVSACGLTTGAITEKVDTQSFETATIETLDIDVSAGNIEFKEGKGDKLNAILYTSRNATDRFKLEADTSGDKLSLRLLDEDKFSFFGNNGAATLVLEVPTKTYKKLNLQSSSGTVDIETAKAKDLIIRSNSGNIKAGELTADMLDLQQDSGATNLEQVNVADRTRIDISSGNVEIGTITTKTLTLDSSSGAVKVRSAVASEQLQADVSSGNVDIRMKEMSKRITTEVNSGNIDLYLPADASFKLDAQANSGEVKTDFPLTSTTHDHDRIIGTAGSGENTVRLDASSGRIVLHKN